MIPEAQEMGEKGPWGSWKGVFVLPLRPELRAEAKVAPRGRDGCTVRRGCQGSVPPTCSPRDRFPLPERLQLPPACRTRVESGWWGCSLRAGCAAAASFFGWIFLKKFLLPDPPPPLSPKAPPRPGRLRGASAQVTFPAAVTLGHPRVTEEGEKKSCSAQTFPPLKQRGFNPNTQSQAEMGRVPYPHEV